MGNQAQERKGGKQQLQSTQQLPQVKALISQPASLREEEREEEDSPSLREEACCKITAGVASMGLAQTLRQEGHW
jgi:hypothetical protein